MRPFLADDVWVALVGLAKARFAVVVPQLLGGGPLPALDADGNTVWIYEYRVNRLIPVCRDIPASDGVRGRQECTGYHLTFDTGKILRSWSKHTS